VIDQQVNAPLGVHPQIREKHAEPAVEEPVIARCALHAWTLEFTHPTTNQRVKFEAPLAPDMQHLLDLLRQYRRQ
jgi:23S rRNA-/tRNA-specific pseudouridylate synthase